jgi:hypothetical protein
MLGDADDWWNDALSERRAAETCRSDGLWPACYHHTGQSIEFALKAIYIRRRGLKKLPEECKGAKWHSLDLIMEQADIQAHFSGLKADRKLYSNWLTVKDWDSNKRFPGRVLAKKDVTDLMVAAFNPSNGIFRWLETVFQKI